MITKVKRKKLLIVVHFIFWFVCSAVFESQARQNNKKSKYYNQRQLPKGNYQQINGNSPVNNSATTNYAGARQPREQGPSSKQPIPIPTAARGSGTNEPGGPINNKSANNSPGEKPAQQAIQKPDQALQLSNEKASKGSNAPTKKTNKGDVQVPLLKPISGQDDRVGNVYKDTLKKTPLISTTETEYTNKLKQDINIKEQRKVATISSPNNEKYVIKSPDYKNIKTARNKAAEVDQIIKVQPKVACSSNTGRCSFTIGPFNNRKEAELLHEILVKSKYYDIFIFKRK